MAGDIKDHLEDEVFTKKPLTQVLKGMVDSDISQVLQQLVEEVDSLQKRVSALEKK